MTSLNDPIPYATGMECDGKKEIIYFDQDNRDAQILSQLAPNFPDKNIQNNFDPIGEELPIIKENELEVIKEDELKINSNFSKMFSQFHSSIWIDTGHFIRETL